VWTPPPPAYLAVCNCVLSARADGSVKACVSTRSLYHGDGSTISGLSLGLSRRGQSVRRFPSLRRALLGWQVSNGGTHTRGRCVSQLLSCRSQVRDLADNLASAWFFPSQPLGDLECCALVWLECSSSLLCKQRWPGVWQQLHVSRNRVSVCTRGVPLCSLSFSAVTDALLLNGRETLLVAIFFLQLHSFFISDISLILLVHSVSGCIFPR